MGINDFYTYTSIVIIHDGNNVILLNVGEAARTKIFQGFYAIDQINKAVQLKRHKVFSLQANNNKLKCEII